MVALLIGTAAIAFVVIAFGTSAPRTTPVPGSTEGAPPPMDARIRHTVDVGATAQSVAADGGSTWVVTYDFERGSGQVVHLDASTGRLVGRIRVDGFAYNIAAGGGSVWVAAKDARGRPALVRIDGQSDRITGTVPGVTGPLAVDASGVWAVQRGRRSCESARNRWRSTLGSRWAQRPYISRSVVGRCGCLGGPLTRRGELRSADADRRHDGDGRAQGRVRLHGSLACVGRGRRLGRVGRYRLRRERGRSAAGHRKRLQLPAILGCRQARVVHLRSA
jgi:hypothetical protein